MCFTEYNNSMLALYSNWLAIVIINRQKIFVHYTLANNGYHVASNFKVFIFIYVEEVFRFPSTFTLLVTAFLQTEHMITCP